MDTTSLNIGCALISTAPIIMGHYIFIRETRYILLSWFCAFISTIFLILCSLSSLFTKNPWVILAYSLLFDVAGKVLLKWIAYRQKFLTTPHSRASLALSVGLGYSLAHVLILYLPICFDQPYSIDYDSQLRHSIHFPNSLDLAISYHCVSLVQMSTSILLFRFYNLNLFVSYILCYIAQFIFSAFSQIPIPLIKIIIQVVWGYAGFICSVYLMRSFSYQSISGDDIVLPSTESTEPNLESKEDEDQGNVQS